VDNVEVVRKLEAAYGSQDYDTVRELLAPDVKTNTPGSEMMPSGVEGCVAADQAGRMSYPDKRTEILDIFGEGDKVVAHIRMTGTNKGGLPWAGVPANDAKIDTDWVQITRHDADGKIVETWAQMDVPKMMMQLGAMPGI
jgi:predicted ester cyclase